MIAEGVVPSYDFTGPEFANSPSKPSFTKSFVHVESEDGTIYSYPTHTITRVAQYKT